MLPFAVATLLVFAVDTDSPEVIVGGGLLVLLGSAAQYVISKLIEFFDKKRAADQAQQVADRQHKKEDIDEAIKRYQGLLDRADRTILELREENRKVHTERHEERDKVNERILRLELKAERQASQIRYLQSLLKAKKMPFDAWEDSDPEIVLPPDGEKR